MLGVEHPLWGWEVGDVGPGFLAYELDGPGLCQAEKWRSVCFFSKLSEST